MENTIKKISFKDYLESKRRLQEAIQNEAHYTINYRITRYCRLVVENDSKKEPINLKPGHMITINWRKLAESPEPMDITFENTKNTVPGKKYRTTMERFVFIRWLGRNSFEEIFEKVVPSDK